MAFAPGWPPSAAGSCSPAGAPRGASGFRPERWARGAAMAGIARLKRRAEFLRVAGGRRKAVTPGLVLQALERPSEHAAMLNGDTNDAPRVGFTASRKVGIAVA